MRNKTKKNIIGHIVFITNMMAFISIYRTLDSTLGASVSLRLIVPMIILFSTNLASSLVIFSSNKTGRKTGDG